MKKFGGFAACLSYWPRWSGTPLASYVARFPLGLPPPINPYHIEPAAGRRKATSYLRLLIFNPLLPTCNNNARASRIADSAAEQAFKQETATLRARTPPRTPVPCEHPLLKNYPEARRIGSAPFACLDAQEACTKKVAPGLKPVGHQFFTKLFFRRGNWKSNLLCAIA
jgi:hypothetical protein